MQKNMIPNLKVDSSSFINISNEYYRSITPNHTEDYKDQKITFYKLYKVQEDNIQHVGFIDDTSILQCEGLVLSNCKIFNTYIKTKKLYIRGSNIYNLNIPNSKLIEIWCSTLNNITVKEFIDNIFIDLSSIHNLILNNKQNLRISLSNINFENKLVITRNRIYG